MTFKNLDGVLLIDTGVNLIASTTSHTLERNSAGHMRLTFGVINEEFEESDVDFYELIKLLPR